MTIKPLADGELERALASLSGWSVVNGKLHRTFEFPDFVAAFGFMAKVALHAERLNHHPEWSNVYGSVRIDLVTHACSGLSTRDLRLAEAIERLTEAVPA